MVYSPPLKMHQVNRRIAHTALLVRDYDEAISFYVNKLGFSLISDIPLEDHKRWVLVSPNESGENALLLAKADGVEQEQLIGNQTGGRVFLFLYTDNFTRDYEKMKINGVRFLESPRSEPYGKVAVFEDLYGNKWDLLEPK